MPATFDIPAVRRFNDELNEKALNCDNGEGMICSNLDEKIKHYSKMCVQLRQFLNQWARAVFSGQIAFDPEVEKLLIEEIRRLLPRANLVAARGRAMAGECEPQGLDELKDHILDFHYLLENWVSPRLSVSPAPRIVLAEALNEKMRERLENM